MSRPANPPEPVDTLPYQPFRDTLDAVCKAFDCTYTRTRMPNRRIRITLMRDGEAVHGTDTTNPEALNEAVVKANLLWGKE